MKTNKILERFKNNIEYYFLGYLLIIVVLSFVIYQLIEKDLTDESHYQNIDLRIVSINSDCSLSDDKFHKPQLCNTILLETINEPHLYCELNTCLIEKESRKIHINIEWLYNHKPGDIVHFDYIRKERFFKIKNK